MKKIGVVLSGCGVYDGTEIHEAVITLLAIARSGAQAICFAAIEAGGIYQKNHVGGRCAAFCLEACQDAGVVGVYAVDLDARGLGEGLEQGSGQPGLAGGVEVHLAGVGDGRGGGGTGST